MIYYHRTNRAEAILHDGFRDHAGSYGFDTILRGVFISDVPVDENEGANGDELLEIILDCDISEYQLIYEGANYREWCVPAILLNREAKVRLMTSEEEDPITRKRWNLPNDLDT
jgi:hypothetical protein